MHKTKRTNDKESLKIIIKMNGWPCNYMLLTSPPLNNSSNQYPLQKLIPSKSRQNNNKCAPQVYL